AAALAKSIKRNKVNKDSLHSESIMLTPAQLKKAEAVRAKLQDLGIQESDVSDAIQWARRRK
ncbi:MAG: hypothetical protein RI552_07240, partial [Spiribacter sp.]|nr:hypothetical protein [Spiribacter sp.]